MLVVLNLVVIFISQLLRQFVLSEHYTRSNKRMNTKEKHTKRIIFCNICQLNENEMALTQTKHT